MLPEIEHPWQVSIPEAKMIQEQLRNRIVIEPIKTVPKIIAAVDVSYTRWDKMGYAVLGVFEIIYDNRNRPIALKEVLVETLTGTVNFPYVPGYLSFREIPMLIPLFERIDDRIDLIIVDGVGIAHPRRLGLASHLGLLYNMPSIGSAKSRLIGNYREPGSKKGDYSELFYKDELIGSVLRSKDNCKPLFISPGNKCSIADARTIIAGLCFKYRVCEPIRRVDAISKQLRKKNFKRS